jgi:hypothetical protein
MGDALAEGDSCACCGVKGLVTASFAKYFTGMGVQGSVKREAAMPIILESMTLKAVLVF